MIKNLFIGLFIFITLSLSAQNEKKYVRQGNNEYSAKKYSEAELSYRKALEKQASSTTATYNLGNSLYRQEKFQDAADEFSRAGDAVADKKDKAEAFHNLGNSLLQSQKYQESIDAYKKALRNNPNDLDTKYNLSLAQHLMKNPPKKPNQQNQQNKNNQDKNNKDKDKKDNKQDNQKNNQNKQQQQQQQAGKISKEDAKRMLQAIQNDENNTQDKLKKEKAAGKKVNPAQNW